MQTSDSNPPLSGQTPGSPPGAWHYLEPTPDNIMRQLLLVRDQLSDVQRVQAYHAEAFPLDDLGQPDYRGHRVTHLKIEKANEIVESYKTDVTKKILAGIAVVVLGFLGAGFKDYIRSVGPAPSATPTPPPTQSAPIKTP